MNDHHPSRSDPAVPARGAARDFRPTLFGEDEEPGGAAAADGLRILGSLQAPPAPRRRHGGHWAIGALAAATLAASAYLVVRQASDPAQPAGKVTAQPVDAGLATHQPTSAGRAAPQPAVSASATAPAGSAGDAGPQAGALSGAARIEAVPAAAQASGPAAAAAVHDPFAGLAQAAPAAPPLRVARAEQPRHQAAAAQAPAKPGAAVQPARRTADEDVELIEAVVAHGSGRQAAARPARAAASAARGSARDVVRRQAPAESTADLLQRCDAVGGLEGMLCRWRICADRWGKDPACPKSSPRPYREPA